MPQDAAAPPAGYESAALTAELRAQARVSTEDSTAPDHASPLQPGDNSGDVGSTAMAGVLSPADLRAAIADAHAQALAASKAARELQGTCLSATERLAHAAARRYQLLAEAEAARAGRVYVPAAGGAA